MSFATRLINLHLIAIGLTLGAAESAPPVLTEDPTQIQALAVGASAPLSAAVRTADGSATTIGQALAGQPTVVVFYRGGWCPYCVTQLAGLGGVTADLQAAGWQLLALSPDRPEVVAAAPVDGVRRLSDAEGHAMRAFGIAFRVDDATDRQLRGYNIDLAAASGQTHRWLPVPSVFLIDAAGVIRFVHADPNYRVRLALPALLEAAKAANP